MSSFTREEKVFIANYLREFLKYVTNQRVPHPVPLPFIRVKIRELADRLEADGEELPEGLTIPDFQDTIAEVRPPRT
jgi:hypothetical protein